MTPSMHSKAPWRRAGPEHPCCHVASVQAADGTRVADVTEENDVNILVGAAKMYETLQEIAVEAEKSGAEHPIFLLIMAHARAAIATAEGRS